MDIFWNHTITQWKDAKQYFSVVLFITLYKVILVLFCGAVYYTVRGSTNFWVYGCNLSVFPFKQKLLSKAQLFKSSL